jgi:endonuclease/exonuclease/phosphatase family metal-dependent hydrolase
VVFLLTLLFFLPLSSFSSLYREGGGSGGGFVGIATMRRRDNLPLIETPSPTRKRWKGNDAGAATRTVSSSSFLTDPPVAGTSEAAKRLERLTLVSFNVAGCQPSAEAPPGWRQTQATKAIRTEILGSNPDILALQECPGDASWAKTHFPTYNVLGVTWSHADYVILMVKKGIHAEAVPMSKGDNDDNNPVVLAKLMYPQESRTLLVASVHLAPFREGEDDRRQQMTRLIQKHHHHSAAGKEEQQVPLIIAGDTNMRQSEDVVMEQTLELTDFWKHAGSNKATKFTWDTIDHGTSCNRYYGESTRNYNARYDRVYGTTSSLTKPLNLKVSNFELIANKPVTNKYHFLSDHFGIVTTFDLEWPAVDEATTSGGTDTVGR